MIHYLESSYAITSLISWGKVWSGGIERDVNIHQLDKSWKRFFIVRFVEDPHSQK